MPTVYSIVSDADLEFVEEEVNRLLDEGWQLAGGIAMAYKHEHSHTGKHVPGHLEYAQSLVKIIEEEPT